jgi:hypothetical protein
MKLSKLFAAAMIFGVLGSGVVNADSSSNIQLSVSDENRVIVSVQLGDTVLQGSNHFSSSMGVATFPVDGLVPSEAGNGSGVPGCTTGCTNENEGGTGAPTYNLVASWGEAMVVLGCDVADVTLYQETADGDVMILEHTIDTDYCAQ